MEIADIDMIYHEQETAFKVNAAVGAVLLNQSKDESPKLRFWHPSASRNRIFHSPWLIKKKTDFRRFTSALMNTNWVEHGTRDRPDTSWSLHLLTNITFYLYPITQHVIGGEAAIPQRVRNNKAILCLDKTLKMEEPTMTACAFSELWL